MIEVEGLRVVKLGAAEVPALQDLHERCRDFVELVDGAPPAPDEAAHLLVHRPEGMPLEDKLVFGVFDGEPGALIGAIDLLRDYPERGEWFIGLLLLDPARRGAGLGTRIHAGIDRWVRSQGAKGLRLVVQKQNPRALRFWQRQGYSVVWTGPQQKRARENVIDLLRKPLAD